MQPIPLFAVVLSILTVRTIQVLNFFAKEKERVSKTMATIDKSV